MVKKEEPDQYFEIEFTPEQVDFLIDAVGRCPIVNGRFELLNKLREALPIDLPPAKLEFDLLDKYRQKVYEEAARQGVPVTEILFDLKGRMGEA